jgi:hypothetical protein
VAQAVLIIAFLMLCGIGLLTAGPGQMNEAPTAGLSRPRSIVIWTVWIGGLTVAVNASSLVFSYFVFSSIATLLLFWLMPYSLVLGVIDAAIYVHERRAVSRSSAPTTRWAITLVLSLSILMLGIVVLCISLFHSAQLGQFDPGGL